MITFSLRPRSGSVAPFTAASVRTLAVSWKDAAAKKALLDAETLAKDHRALANTSKKTLDNLVMVTLTQAMGKVTVATTALTKAMADKLLASQLTAEARLAQVLLAGNEFTYCD